MFHIVVLILLIHRVSGLLGLWYQADVVYIFETFCGDCAIRNFRAHKEPRSYQTPE